MTPVVSKVSHLEISPIFAALQLKITNRVNGGFDRRATKIHVRSFWLSCDYYPISVLSTNGATNGGLNHSCFKIEQKNT